MINNDESISIAKLFKLPTYSDEELEKSLPLILSVFEINDGISDLKLVFYDRENKVFNFLRKWKDFDSGFIPKMMHEGKSQSGGGKNETNKS